MPVLKAITIAFVTHGTPPSGPYPLVNPKIHVFVKNRSCDTSQPEQGSDFASNLLAYRRYEAQEPEAVAHEINPYLGHATALGAIPVQAYAGPVSIPAYTPPTSFNIPLRTRPIALEEIMLPVVNIHLHPSDSYIEWFFSYTITFTFDDGSSYSDTTDQNGITGILLNSDNRNYSSISKELHPVPPRSVQEAHPVFLNRVTIEFGTHDDGKDKDTQVNVHIVNRLSANSSQDIAIGLNILPIELPKPVLHLFSDRLDFPGDKTVEFTGTALASQTIALHNIVLPVVYIIVVPTGDDRWIFDYKVTYYFDNGQEYSSMTKGVILDRYNHKHMGVYNGATFPTLPGPGRAPLTGSPTTLTRIIPWSFLGAKLDELLNKRQDPPLFRLRLDNTGEYGVLRESYFDLQSIEPDPPPPGTLSAPPYKEQVSYGSSPASLGILSHDAYFDNINSKQITITVDTFNPLPVTARIEFQTPVSIPFHVGVDLSVDLTAFWIEISFNMTKVVDGKIDLLSWVNEINNLEWRPQPDGSIAYRGTVAGKQLDGIARSQLEAVAIREALIDNSGLKVHLEPDGTFPGTFQKTLRESIFKLLGTPSVITHKTPADTITDKVNAWLLGGLVAGDSRDNSNNHCIVQSASYQDDNLVITYTGPRTYVDPAPQGWPAGVDFTTGTLANIDHIVVLTKENRSFDTMLGYLSLPLASGGQGRADVDGLKGNEFNLLNGKKCPSFPFEPEDTIFSPNTPNDPEHVQKAVNNGKMDGFATSFADQDGPEIAPRIMGYHTAENVPVYDALARDFAISHRWFASHPGPSFCNRFYETSGRLNINPDGTWNIDDSGAPSVPALTKTIFDYLPAGVSWKYFEHGYCFLRYFANHTFDPQNIVSYDDPVSGFLALAKKGQLPNVSFIDPHYIDLPPNANCDEPPSDVKEGQKLAQQIVEALVTSPQWEKTLLIITYDEHGGFFDHVPPPKAVKNSPDSLETYGCRVPTFIVSPWVKGGAVVGYDGVVIHHPGDGGNALGLVAATPKVNITPLYFDHTSILKTIARRFISQNPPYLSARYAAAHDLSSVIGTELRPNQFLPFIPYTLVYGHSGKCLEVQNGSLAQGALLWQTDPNSADPQQFRFEDAGDGYWYVRTFTGHLYLTADASLKVKQDVKYPANGTAAAGNAPNSQRWKFTGGVTLSRLPSGLTVSNAAFPDKVLQPSGNSANSQIPVVLAAPETLKAGLVIAKNPWLVSNHLSPANQSPADQQNKKAGAITGVKAKSVGPG